MTNAKVYQGFHNDKRLKSTDLHRSMFQATYLNKGNWLLIVVSNFLFRPKHITFSKIYFICALVVRKSEVEFRSR